MTAAFAERSVMRTLEGGCSVPIGVETEWVDDDGARKLRIRGTVVSLDGKDGVYGEMTEPVASLDEAESLGTKLAQDLVNKGAQKILDLVNKGRENGAAVKLSDV